MAHGNFFPSMQLEQASDGQEVCGPIIWAGRDPWDLPALEVEILFVVVTQFTCGGLVIGLTQGPTTFSHGSELQGEWETDVFDIGGGPTQVPGRARARARHGARQAAGQGPRATAHRVLERAHLLLALSACSSRPSAFSSARDRWARATDSRRSQDCGRTRIAYRQHRGASKGVPEASDRRLSNVGDVGSEGGGISQAATFSARTGAATRASEPA